VVDVDQLSVIVLAMVSMGALMEGTGIEVVECPEILMGSSGGWCGRKKGMRERLRVMMVELVILHAVLLESLRRC
jgi:hypothetical protein